MSTASPFSSKTRKNMREVQRSADLKRKIDKLRELTNSAFISCSGVLHRVADLLNGKNATAPIVPILPPPSPGPIETLGEVHNYRERARYAKIMAGYQALQKYITDNGLSPNAQLTRAELLDIIISEVKKIKPAVCAPASSPAPIVAPEPIFPISSLQHLLPFYNLLNVPFPSQ